MNIIIIDDDSLVTLSLKTILETEDDFNVIATGNSGQHAIELYKKHKPDILLSDIRMGEMDGIEASKKILEYDKNARILLLTTFQDDEYVIEALRLGVKGYILKQDYDSLVSAIKAVMSNQSVYVNEVMQKIPNLISVQPKNKSTIGISEKELSVIECIAQGLNNKEISQTLFLSEGTIRNYISMILTKLELRDRTQIVIYYFNNIK